MHALARASQSIHPGYVERGAEEMRRRSGGKDYDEVQAQQLVIRCHPLARKLASQVYQLHMSGSLSGPYDAWERLSWNDRLRLCQFVSGQGPEEAGEASGGQRLFAFNVRAQRLMWGLFEAQKRPLR
mmetsp:Transcript_21138/g.47604  ORF Transcript_21138/g.47604 Transcript_21138/m.47604 type:complete len:127 (-) Transcript_21138:648-1028(-)